MAENISVGSSWTKTSPFSAETVYTNNALAIANKSVRIIKKYKLLLCRGAFSVHDRYELDGTRTLSGNARINEIYNMKKFLKSWSLSAKKRID